MGLSVFRRNRGRFIERNALFDCSITGARTTVRRASLEDALRVSE